MNLFGSWKSNLVARDRRLGERDCVAEKKEGRVSKQGREERNVISGEDGVGAAVSVDVNPAAHFPFDVAVPPPPPRSWLALIVMLFGPYAITR